MSAQKAGAEPPPPVCDSGAAPPNAENVKAIYFVTAEAGPGLAPRLVEPFAKLGLVPARIHMSTEQRGGEEIAADLRTGDVSRRVAHLIDKALRRVVGVRQVIMLVD